MNFETVNNLVAQLGTMRYFPSDPAVRIALVELMGDLTDSEDEVRWLIKRVRTLYAEWPGERELRACFCSRFRPKDGINMHSGIYGEGIPSERPEQNQIAGPNLLALPPGHVATADPIFDAGIQALAEITRMPAPLRPRQGSPADRFARLLQEIETPPHMREPDPPPTPQIITQADIDRAVLEYRASLGRES